MFAVLRRHPSPKEEALTQMQRLLAARGYAGFTFGSNKELGASLDKCVSKNDPFFNTSPRLRSQPADVADRGEGAWKFSQDPTIDQRMEIKICGIHFCGYLRSLNAE